jgi:putative SOS response-associated peptidase YedK
VPVRFPLPPRYNIAPSTDVPVIRDDPEQGVAALAMHWGLVPSWVKDRSAWREQINARGETVDTLPTFRNAFKRWRCVLPASGFYEWQRNPLDSNPTNAKAPKQPFYMFPARSNHFAFAGVCERWVSPDGEVLHSAAIITTAANELMATIHNRMPVILHPADVSRWLAHENADVAALKALLVPYPAALMKARAVSRRVGNTRNDDADLIAPVAAA